MTTITNVPSADEVLKDLSAVLAKLQALDLDAMDAKYLAPMARETQSICAFAGALDAQITLRVVANGQDVPGVATKPVVKHRQWNAPETAAELAREAFGNDAFTAPELKSPAQIEKLGELGKTFVAMASFKPEAGKKVVY